MNEEIMMNQRVYTVLELNTTVRNLIKSEFPAAIWICGEIQGLRLERDKKHTYFELVQKDPEADQIMAKVRLALFAGRKPTITRRIQETNGAFELKNDIEVKFLCEVSLHPPTGSYSLVVVDVDPVYTLGKVAQNRAKIIDELRKEGLLERNKMQIVPQVPLRIGLITALDSAAYHDFTNELETSGYGFCVWVHNAHMQGKQVESDIVAALADFNARGTGVIDVVVITRGGGSKADLSWFDNKRIAHAVAASPFPVVAALGHQIDVSITDMVAHTAVKTPTKAAQMLVEAVREFQERLNVFGEQILTRATDYLGDQRQRLEAVAVKIDSSVPRFFRFHRDQLIASQHRVRSAVKVLLQAHRQGIGRMWEEIAGVTQRALSSEREKLVVKEGMARLLNPRNVLKRGYSITLKGTKAVKSAGDVSLGDQLQTFVYEGRITSEVKKVQKKEKKEKADE